MTMRHRGRPSTDPWNERRPARRSKTIGPQRAEASDRLRSLPLLKSATDEQLARVDRLTYEVEIAAGRVITRECAHAQGFFLIVSGRAMVTVAGVEHSVLDRGMFFGETALLDRRPEPQP